jgi:PAS domain S-box-containing protein
MPNNIVRAGRSLRQHSITWHLIALAAAIIIPAILFGALMIQLYASGERHRVQRDASQRAQALMEAVDRDLAIVTAQLTVLSQADSLQVDDLGGFYRRARRAAQEFGYHMVLSNPAGQQVVNTRAAYGAALPRMAEPASIAAVIRSGTPLISNVFIGAVAKQPIYAIYVPVRINGQIRYVLTASLPLSRIYDIVRRQNLPEQWSAAVADGNRILVARRFENETYAGKPGQNLPHLPPGEGGIFRGINVAGIDVIAPYYQSSLSGWAAGIGVPVSVLEAPVQRLIWPLIGIAALISAVASLFVAVIGKRTADALKSLVAHASDVDGSGGRTLATPVAEVNEASVSINKAWRELAAAQKALNASDELLRQALSIGKSYAFQWRADTDEVNRVGAEEVLGVPLPRTQSAYLAQVDAKDRHRLKAVYAGSVETPAYHTEFRFRRPGGEWIWLTEHGLNLFDAAGKLAQQTGIVADITESKKASVALRESQALLQLAADAAGVGTFDYDVAAKTTLWSDKMKELAGLAPSDPPPRRFISELVHREERAAVLKAMRECLDPQGNGVFNLTYRVIRRNDGHTRWLLVRGSTLFSDESEGGKRPLRHSGIAVDVTETREAEEIQKLLIKELSHRVKNSLATVQAIANQTSRRTVSKDDFVTTFTARLQSLARAHALLTQSNWQGTDIVDIVREQLTFAGHDSRIVPSGPRIRLSSQYSLQMALVMHELGTNARKYGALSVPGGKLEITWRVSNKVGNLWLLLDWVETGGPPVKTPKSKGFGSALLERSFSAGGETQVEYRREGLVCKIRLPMEQATQADPQAA